MSGLQPSGSSVVVREKALNVNILWGFLSVVLGAALLRGHFGAETDAGRLTGDIVGGILFVGAVSAWIWFRRHPAHITVSPDEINFQHRGQSGKGTTLPHVGDLYVHVSWMRNARLLWLKVQGSDVVIPLQMFDIAEVRNACVQMNWRFAEGSP